MIKEKGIGGFFLDTDHTLNNFKERIWIPNIFPRSKSKDPKDVKDLVDTSHERYKMILSKTDFYHLPEDKAREIDKIVEKAKKALPGSN